MYRQYEDPRKLQDQLDSWLEDHPRDTWDEYDYETYTDLKERINFAWQDEEYDEMYRDPEDERWMEENVYSAADVDNHYYYRFYLGTGTAWVDDSYVVETDEPTTDYGALTDALIDYLVSIGDSRILDGNEYEWDDEYEAVHLIDDPDSVIYQDELVQGGNAGDVLHHYGEFRIEEITEDQLTDDDIIIPEV